jgi:Protein of unknown function (DUF3224)
MSPWAKILTDNPMAQPNPARGARIVCAAMCLLFAISLAAIAGIRSPASTAIQKEPIMTHHAVGTFEVNIIPQKPDNPQAESAKLGRMSIDKQFDGDLKGVSTGEMLSVITEHEGSAGYVAIERVNGTLQGRSGTFALQHFGTMTRGVPQMNVSVVPDSGTGQLTGLAGTMTINIVDKKHFYDFAYTIADAP